MPNKKILIGGDFTKYNGARRRRVACLNPDGSLDASFNAEEGANAKVTCMLIQTDGKLLIAGSFTKYKGTRRRGIARLHPDGSLDTSFDPGRGTVGVSAIALQSDGKVLIGGDFMNCSGRRRKGIARLHPDGSLDTSFDPVKGSRGFIRSGVYALGVQADGKVIVGGAFSTFNETERRNIARIHANGKPDISFHSREGVYGNVYDVAIQPNSDVIIGGNFTNYKDIKRKSLARIHPDGSLDNTFDIGTGANRSVHAIVLQEDGKVIIGGDFTDYNCVKRNGIARLHPDGSLDTSFDPGAGVYSKTARYSKVTSLAIQPDGRVLVGGEFETYNGTVRKCIARILVSNQE